MSPATPHNDAEVIHAGHQANRPVPDDTAGQGHHMQSEDGLRLGIIEHAFPDHQIRAALFAVRLAVFGGLEDELHGSGKPLASTDQHLRHAHQNGRVGIVTARVGHARLLAVVLGLGPGGERQIYRFTDRQGVHVGAQRDHRVRPTAPEDADHPCVGDLCGDFHSELAQMFGHESGGPELPIPQLGILMNIAPPGDHLGLHLGGKLVDLGGQAVAVLGSEQRRGNDGK